MYLIVVGPAGNNSGNFAVVFRNKAKLLKVKCHFTISRIIRF